MVSIVIPPAIGVLAVAAAASFGGWLYTLDQLIKREYELHRADWESDGRPAGRVFFRPAEARFFAGRRAYARIYYGWLFTTPRWIEGDPVAQKLLTRSRRLSAGWHLGFAATMLSTWIYTALQNI